jgi:hypothetical protein
MTLPSRLKARDGTRETLDQIASALNINGNQNIAKLRMSIDQKAALNGHDRPGRLEVRAQSRDMRIPSRERSSDAPQIMGTDEDDVATFDIDFFPTEAIEQMRGRQSTKNAHVFGQAENYRDEDLQSEPANEEEEGHERARRRAAGLPIIQKSVHLFLFPSHSVPHFVFRRFPSFGKVLPNSIFLGTSPLVLLTMDASAGHGYPCHSLCLTASPAYSFSVIHTRCLYR